MSTRKRARTDDGQFKADDPATPQDEAFVAQEPELPVNVASLATFMRIEQPDTDRLASSLDLARAAAASIIGRPVREAESHNIRHGIHMLAAQLLLKDQLDAAVPTGAAIPSMVRYLWHGAS